MFRKETQDAKRDERDVRRNFWPKFRKVAAQLPFAEDLLAAYFCAFDRETPHQVRAVLLGALAYFIMPFDVAPDMLLVLGFADDAAVLRLGRIALSGKPAELRDRFDVQRVYFGSA